VWKIVAAKKNFYCSKEHTARPQTASRREPRITSCWPLFLSGNKKQTKQEREKKNSLSLSLSLSLASQFLKTLLAAAFEASSARKLPATTIRNKSKLTRSPALLSLSLSLSLCALLLVPRLLGNPRLGNGDWYTWEERNERPLNPSQV